MRTDQLRDLLNHTATHSICDFAGNSVSHRVDDLLCDFVDDYLSDCLIDHLNHSANDPLSDDLIDEVTDVPGTPPGRANLAPAVRRIETQSETRSREFA